METKVCPYCGAENREGARHCRQCGRSLTPEAPAAAPPQPSPGGAACPSCHAPLNSGARFCPRCGAPVSSAAAPPAAPTLPAAPPAYAPLPAAPAPFGAPPAPPAVLPSEAAPAKKRFPVLPVALGGGLLLLCVCVASVYAVTRFWDSLPWNRPQPTEVIVVTEPPVMITEARPTDTPTAESVRRAERWAFREVGGASPGLLLFDPNCASCDVRAEVFRPVLRTIELGGDRLYYWDELLESVYYVTPDGAIHEIPAPDGTVEDFEVAPDASLIAWGVYDSDNEGVTARIVLTNGEGEQPRILTEVRHTHDEGARNLIPFAWSPDLKTLYVAQRYWGIGGYILFDILPEPMTVDVATGTSTSLNATDCSLVALSPDGNVLATLVNADDTNDLILRDLRTGTEQRIAGTPGRRQAGDLVFSPDSRYLAYTEALGDPSAEAYSVRRVDVATGAVETLITDEVAEWFDVAGWVSNEAGGFDVVIVKREGSERVTPEGRELLSQYWFVGSWIEEE